MSLQALQELPEATALLDVCMAIVRRAYELYSAETDDDLKLRSDDPILLSAAGDDAGLLLRALEVIDQHPPNPLGGGGSDPDSATWSRWLHEADEIASPGQISEQIKDALARASVVIADITGVNPNVMWELGYADGQGKPIVILNQDPSSSPFDMVDRRQVSYHRSPTDADEASLVQHLAAALSIHDRPGMA